MPAHDEFRELGALAAIGQITASEHEDLSVHLRECAECREAYADYSRILRQDLPQADPARFRGKRSSLHPATDAELRERFWPAHKLTVRISRPKSTQESRLIANLLRFCECNWPWQPPQLLLQSQQCYLLS